MHGHQFRGSLFAAVCVLALIGSSCSGNSGEIVPSDSAAGSGGTSTVPDGGSTATGAIDWGSCDDVDIAVPAETGDSMRSLGMQCAELEVPVDHDTADGRTINLAVARIPSTGGDDDRIGSLVVNPGGPGGSGLEFLAGVGPTFPRDLRKQFDIVSFDPRGIAASTPLDCLTPGRRKEIVEADPIEDPAEQAATDSAIEAEIAKGCEKADAELFRNMGTDEVVDDLEDLRVALGDEELSYLGLSYGTRIGAVYATRYPDKVRAIVLDGSVTPSRDIIDSGSGQAKGIIREYEAFVAACDADSECPLAPDAAKRINAVADQLDAKPIAVTSGSDGDEKSLTKDQFITGFITSLYDPSSAAATLSAVDAISGNDVDRRDLGASYLLNLAGQQSSQRPDGTYGNGFEAQGVVNCLDADSPLEGAEVAELRRRIGTVPPLFETPVAADSPSCVSLPTGDDLEIAETTAKDRILIVGTKGDPATPIEWTGAMAKALGDPAVLTYAGHGHTASLRVTCATDQVAEFFGTGTVPDDLADCPTEKGEGDIYDQLIKQFEAMGLQTSVGECIVDEIRDEIDPLEIMSLNGDDPDPGIISAIQGAATSCR